MNRRAESASGYLPAQPGIPTADATGHLPRVDPGRLLGMLRRRGWWLVAAVLVAATGAAIWLAHAPKIYRSSGSVYVSTEAPRMLDIRAVAPEESRDLAQLRSVADGMLSSTLLLRVIERNGLAADESFAGEKLSEQGLLGLLRAATRVELRRGTRIIDVRVDDTDPERARQLVESIKAEYETWTAERRESLTEMVSEGLAKEEVRLRSRMEESVRKLEQFREVCAVPGLGVASAPGGTGGEYDKLGSQLTQARAVRLQLEAEVEAFKGFDPGSADALAGLANNDYTSEVHALTRSLRDKQAEFARIKERYLHKHPVYQEIASEIAGLEQNLAVAVKSAGEAIEKGYRVARENEDKLAAELEEARGRAVDVEGLRAEFVALGREADADRELHATVAKRLRETSMAALAPSSILRWEENPLAPEKPIRPRKAITLGVAVCGGMFLGLLLMCGFEIADRRVRDANAAARAVGAPVLARVPQAVLHGDGGMVVTTDPGSDAAEAFRRLRAVLGQSGLEETGKTILFTSSREGEGKSFCAINFAASLALQGHRTLLIDADMRHPGLSRESAPGLGDYLSGVANPADGCLFTELPKLCVFASGEKRPDAAELLSGTRFPALLDDAYRWFDRVVVDVPAVLSASDVQAVSRFADHTCLVVHGDATDRRSLERSAEMLRAAGARLAGIVWNESPGSANRNESCYVRTGRPVAVRSILAATEPIPSPRPGPRVVTDRDVA